MINPQWLELPMSRTNFYGPKDVRAIEVRLYMDFRDHTILDEHCAVLPDISPVSVQKSEFHFYFAPEEFESILNILKFLPKVHAAGPDGIYICL